MRSSPVVLLVLDSTTNPRQPLAAKGCSGGLLQIKEPLKHHLAAIGCTGFVLEFNT